MCATLYRLAPPRTERGRGREYVRAENPLKSMADEWRYSTLPTLSMYQRCHSLPWELRRERTIWSLTRAGPRATLCFPRRPGAISDPLSPIAMIVGPYSFTLGIRKCSVESGSTSHNSGLYVERSKSGSMLYSSPSRSQPQAEQEKAAPQRFSTTENKYSPGMWASSQ
jgi:hypothetical protein